MMIAPATATQYFIPQANSSPSSRSSARNVVSIRWRNVAIASLIVNVVLVVFLPNLSSGTGPAFKAVLMNAQQVDQSKIVSSSPASLVSSKIETPIVDYSTTSLPMDPGDREWRKRIAKYKTDYEYHEQGRGNSLNKSQAVCGDAPDFDVFFHLGSKSRSRLSEDKIIYKTFFRNVELGGFIPMSGPDYSYIELGAFDGATESNTRFFDACLGWEGLLIEGNYRQFPILVENRPNAHRLKFAPSCSAEYEAVNKTIQFADTIWTNAGLHGKAKAYDNHTKVNVACGPITPPIQDLLLKDGRKKVNFFSLDVEGAEEMVLQTLDFSMIAFDVVMIEVENTFCRTVCEARDNIRIIMAQAGYHRIEKLVQASDVYVHPDIMQSHPPQATINSQDRSFCRGIGVSGKVGFLLRSQQPLHLAKIYIVSLEKSVSKHSLISPRAFITAANLTARS